MADQKEKEYTRENAIVKLRDAREELTDLQEAGFGNGSDVNEDGEAVQGAINRIDDALEAIGETVEPDKYEEEDDDEDEKEDDEDEDGE